ncbi:hypothetical protein Tco_0049401 [Tanacetum coccineum]
MKVEESLNVTFDETPSPLKTSPLEDDELVKEKAIEVRPICNDLEDISLENDQIVNIKESKTHPLENVIGTKWVCRNKLDENGVVTRNKARYGYIKNHKKTVKNGQARTRESEEYKKKSKNQSRSQKSQASVKSSQDGQKLVNKSQPIKDKT